MVFTADLVSDPLPASNFSSFLLTISPILSHSSNLYSFSFINLSIKSEREMRIWMCGGIPDSLGIFEDDFLFTSFLNALSNCLSV